jgi:ribosomal protein L4
MKAKALYTILSQKYRDGEILFVDSIPEAKTKNAVAALKTLAGVKGFEKLVSKRKNSAVIALASKSRETERSLKNLSNMEVIEARNLHPLALLNHKYIVIENPDVALKSLPKLK